MMNFADRVFEFCASLKLAILLILSLAFFLAVATVYEARYGAQAAQNVVYGSTAFLVLMAGLAINVMAAVLVRYPWTRKQTGFIITHCGIEILLAGCLISYRQSVDGRVAFRPGDTVSSINLNTEQLSISLPGSNRAVPVDLWQHAGFPSIWRLLASPVKPLPDHPTWPAGQTLGFSLDDSARIEVLDWLPAARLDRQYIPTPENEPAVQLHLTGTTPAGMPIDDSPWIYSANGNGSVNELFNGTIEVSLWRARSDAETAHFLHPPTAAELSEQGRITLLGNAGDAAANVNVADAIGHKLPLGSTGFKIEVLEYLPQSELKDGKLVKAGDDPIDPIARIRLISPANVSHEYILSANYPFLNSQVDSNPGDNVTLLFEHRATIITRKDGHRGRLQFLQTSDGKLLARRFGLTGLEDAAEVSIGQNYPAWMGLHWSVLQHVPSARLIETYRPLKISPNKMADAMRAIHVALVVDGQRTETWLARGAGPKPMATLRGQASLSYGFDDYALPFSVTLVSAQMQRDPGSQNAASYSSVVKVADATGGWDTQHITMNEPFTSDGLTFYQSGFDDSIPGGPVSALSVRKDPGWIPKYTGCALIVIGVFMMFYMKAYFQKPAIASSLPVTTRIPIGATHA